jgi:DNA-binding IclR family transcriptional regulator
MVLATVTAAAFVLMFLPAFAFDFLEKRQRTAALRLLARIGIALALYCVASGIAMLAGWADAVAAAGPSEVAARAFRYWPYGLIVAGGFWTLVYGATQRAGGRR